MTYEEAARILDPETSREALLPYAYDPQYQQTLLRKACVIAANVLEGYAALTVSCPEGDLIIPGGEPFKAKFLSLPRVSYEPLHSADIVPIVRCKECKHQIKTWHQDNRMKSGGYYLFMCDLNQDPFVSHVVNGADDDFCSVGEKKGLEDKS